MSKVAGEFAKSVREAGGCQGAGDEGGSSDEEAMLEAMLEAGENFEDEFDDEGEGWGGEEGEEVREWPAFMGLPANSGADPYTINTTSSVTHFAHCRRNTTMAELMQKSVVCRHRYRCIYVVIEWRGSCDSLP